MCRRGWVLLSESFLCTLVYIVPKSLTVGFSAPEYHAGTDFWKSTPPCYIRGYLDSKECKWKRNFPLFLHASSSNRWVLGWSHQQGEGAHTRGFVWRPHPVHTGLLKKKTKSQARWKKVLVVGPQLPAQATSDRGKNYKFFHVVVYSIT